MNRKILLAVISGFLLPFLFYSCGGDYKTPEDIKGKIAWLDPASALPVFPFGTKPIYMFFYADWCPISKQMRENIFSRPEIIEYLNDNFTCIAVNPDSLGPTLFFGEEINGPELAEMFKLDGYPGHYFFDVKGQLRGARIGYIELPVFKQLLKFVAEGYMDKYNFATFQEQPESVVDTVYGEF